MKQYPRVLIAAPVRNRAWCLPKYLHCLSTIQYPKDKLQFFFLVNDSTDESLQILEGFQRVVQGTYGGCKIEVMDLGTPEDKRTGAVRAKVYHSLAILRNRILQEFSESSCEYLFSVDSDIYVRPPILGRLLSHQKVMVAAQISNLRNRMCPNALLKVGSQGLKRFQAPVGEDPKIHEVYVTGAVSLMSREVLGSQYAWHSHGEDFPFCNSLWERGLKVYLDTALLAEHDYGPAPNAPR